MARSSVAAPVRIGLIKAVIVVAAVVVAVVAWVAVLVATDIDQRFEQAQAEAQATNLALVFEEQIYREMLAADQSLRIAARDWKRDPEGFDLAGVQRQLGAMPGAPPRLMLLDAHGRVAAATDPGLLHATVSLPEQGPAHGVLVSGPVQRNGQWSFDIVRRLGGAHGGAVVASYDLDALMHAMAQADLGPHGLMLLAGRDGVVYALSARGAAQPGMSIAASPLAQAMTGDAAASWIGPSPVDGVVRIHALRAVPQQGLMLVAGLDRAAALAPSEARRQQALIGAAAITLLVLLIAFGVGSMIVTAEEREARLAEDRMVLEAANAELARAREQADEKTQQLGTTLASMTDGVSMYDAEMRLVLWNGQASALTGIPSALMQPGVSYADVLRIQAAAGEFGPDWGEADLQRRLDEARSFTGTRVTERARPTGTVIELRQTRLPQGGWVTLYTDITARKLAEAAQARAREQAETAAQEKSRFVAIVSHEIRTPLNVALNALTLLDRSTLSPPQRHLVETGLLAGETLMGLLNDILDLSRMQVGRLSLRPAPFLLRPLLDGLVEMFRQQAAERGLILSVQVAPGVPDRLMTDAGRLRQVLMNLLNNVVKFAAPGPASIRVGFATLGGAPVLRLAVRDCGPEIPDLDRARLFRPFSQLEQPRRGHGGGTGLGLAICQLLANLLGGQIGCDTVAEGGKEFWLTLPADVMNVPVALPIAMEAGQCWLPRTRLLLVEDMPANRMIVATLLRREGHRVDVAESGEEAVAMIAARPYDLVLLDIFMPGIDGLETARRVRALPGPAGRVKLVALTANVSPEDLAEYRAAGMDDVVPKPVERASLLSALARHVWLRHRVVTVASLSPAAAVPAPAEPVLDWRQVEAWQAGLPPAVAERLFRECLQQLRDMLPGVEAALVSRDLAAVKRVAHAFGGVAGNYGLAALAALIRSIAEGAQEGVFNPHRDAAAVDAAISQAEQVVGALTPVAAA